MSSLLDPKLPRGLKMGFTWDIAMACVYLVSAAGGYISGEIMYVDGGSRLRRGTGTKPDGHLNVDRSGISELSAQRERNEQKSPTGVAKL